MKSYSRTLLCAASACGMLMSSCGNEAPWSIASGEDGRIALNLTTDASVYRSTRADDAMSPVVPGADEFSVSLKSTDGSYQKKWNNLTSFNKEEGFPMGSYNIVVEYGDPGTEGFTNPYYKGESTVDVMLGQESPVSITATLANSMVSVRYSDAMSQWFTNYSATLQSDKVGAVNSVPRDETRPLYMCPGIIQLKSVLTNEAGKTVTVDLGSFTAVAKRHYIVTIDVNGDSQKQNGTLVVTYEEDVVPVPVEVSLTDELFNAPVPYAEVKGFENDVTIEHFHNITYAGNPEIHVFGYGGIKSAKLTVGANSGNSNVLAGRTIELVGADAATQQELKDAGVDCSGFFRNTGSLGVVNFKEFMTKAGLGDYRIVLDVTDKLGRSMETEAVPVMKAKINPVSYSLEGGVSQPEYLGNQIEVAVTSNCEAIKDELTFEVRTADGYKQVAAELIPDAAGSPTRADGSYTFRFRLTCNELLDSKCDVRCLFGGTSYTHTLEVKMPAYEIETDALAKSLRLRVKCDDEKLRKAILLNAKVMYNSTVVSSSKIERDIEGNMITVTGLNPNTTYTAYSLVLGSSASAAGASTKVPDFGTEADANVPNGNFSQLTKTIDINPINAGGEWNYLMNKNRQNTSAILVNEANGWASLNSKTCYEDSKNKNTWFMVPSTIASAGRVIVRSVAYDHDGTSPDLYAFGIKMENRYSHNAPKSFAHTSAGELFLGTYSFTGEGENREDGMKFETRPTSVSFAYSYAPVQNEKAHFYVSVLNDKDEVIASADETVTAQTNSVKTLNLSAYQFGQKAAKLQIRMISAEGANVAAPIPNDLRDVTDNSDKVHNIAANEYKSLCVGSVLTVTEVKLNY